MKSPWWGWWAESRHRRVAALDVAIVGAGVGLAATTARSAAVLSPHLPAGLALLAGLFFIVEILPLHLEFRGQAYSLSLSEAPLVVGLLCWPAAPLVAARVLGGALALLFHRKQPMHKLVFNVANQLLEASVALAFFLAVHGGVTGSVIGAAPSALGAVTVSSTMAIGLVCLVISLLVGRLDAEVFKSFLGVGLVGILVNTAIAVVVVCAAKESGYALLPIAVVGLACGGIYRAYVGLRHKHASLQTLYDFTRSIGHAASGESGLLNILLRTRAMLRSGRAGLLLYSEDDSSGVLRAVNDEGVLVTLDYTSDPADWPLAMVMSSDTVLRIAQNDRDPGHQQFLAHRQAQDAIIAPVKLDGRTTGVLVVHDRDGDFASYTEDDAQLFATIATHVGNVLDNSRLVDRLRHESSHDALTGLANRAYFRSRLTSLLAGSRPRLAVLLADLDRFKEINDTLGHHHGDLLIAEVARRIADTAPRHATVARLGGDEFAILLPEADSNAGQALANAIRRSLQAPCVLDGVAVEVDVSIGIASAPEHGVEETMLMKRADMAMYAAKAAGSGAEIYNFDRDEYSPRRLALATQVRGAIQQGQFQLHYQPQVTPTGDVAGVEALVRWDHPEFGRVPPAEFIPIAEQSGAIAPLTDWVLETAIAQLAQWRADGIDLCVSVNVSMRNLLDGEIVASIREQLQRAQIPADRLTLEITETHVMSDPNRTLPVLHRLHDLGLRLSIDDFGTGYSSLSYLRQLPVHEIKIDKSFVVGLDQQDNRTIVSAIVGVANSLGLETVAEGIESEETQHHLVAIGCTRLQGFYFARPMPVSALNEWLDRRAEEFLPHPKRMAPVVPLLPRQPFGAQEKAVATPGG